MNEFRSKSYGEIETNKENPQIPETEEISWSLLEAQSPPPGSARYVSD